MEICYSGGAVILGPADSARTEGIGGAGDASDVGNVAVTALIPGIVALGTRGVWTQPGSGSCGGPCPQSGTRRS